MWVWVCFSRQLGGGVNLRSSRIVLKNGIKVNTYKVINQISYKKVSSEIIALSVFSANKKIYIHYIHFN